VISWQYYPKSDQCPKHLLGVIKVFKSQEEGIGSKNHQLKSNEVLAQVTRDLVKLGFAVEKGKKAAEKIKVPVLFGLNGQLEKSFEADAFDEKTGTVLEVEAGRAVVNNQFLKDLFQACLMHGVYFLVIAVRTRYRKLQDFNRVLAFFDALYASRRLELPLKGILVIGY